MEWIELNMKPYIKHEYYWVRTCDGFTCVGYWDGDEWVSVHPSYEYKLEDYTIDNVCAWAVMDKPEPPKEQ